MEFFDVRSSDGRWGDIDLNRVRPLFQVFVGRIVLDTLVWEKVEESSVKPNESPCQRLWIKPNLNMGQGYPFTGGKLIDVGPDCTADITRAPVIKHQLSLESDRETISKYELTGIWGPDDLSARLCRFFQTGIDVSPMKLKVFPGLG